MTDKPSNNGRQTDGTFAKGNHYGLGRKHGSPNNATLMVEKIFSDSVGEIARAVVERAKLAEPWAVALVVRSPMPPARDSPARISLPKIESASDIPKALAAILDAVSEGRLTPSEGLSLSGIFDAARSAFELDKLFEEVAVLKQQIVELQRQPGSLPDRNRL